MPGRVTHHNSTSQPSPRGFLTGVGTASPCSHQKSLQERFTRRHFDTRAFLTALGLAQDLFQCLLHWGSQRTTPLSCPLFFSCISPGLFGIKKRSATQKPAIPAPENPNVFIPSAQGWWCPQPSSSTCSLQIFSAKQLLSNYLSSPLKDGKLSEILLSGKR